MPSFAVDGGWGLVAARGVSDAALLLAFGIALFGAAVAPRALKGASADTVALIETRLRRSTVIAVAAALAALLLWTVRQAVDFAGLQGAARALPTVLTQTMFGQVILVQAAVLAGAWFMLGRCSGLPRWPVAALTGAALALHAGHGHAIAMHGVGLLLLSDVVHLLAAGAWFGGLPPLLYFVALAPPRTGAAGARWFTPLGKACVVAMVVSASYQFWELVGGLPGLIGTAYGWAAGAKMAALALLLGFAVANRYRFAPALLRPGREQAAKRVLIRSITVQTGVGLLAVVAAATLSQLPPAIHEQPLWPFAHRPSLVAMADPDLAAEVARALLLVAGAVAAATAGAIRRRVRWAALAATFALLWAAAPHFDLLFVEAYPTSFYHSPTGFSAAAIARGARLYPDNCAACHGADGSGDGPAAAGLAEPPADLTAPHLWEHADGEMFWWLSHGMEGPEGGLVMPGFADRLSVDERWDLIDYIRAHNAGVSMRDAGAWPGPVQAPSLDLACADMQAATTADLRGSVLHIVAATADVAAAPVAETIEPGVRMITVLLTKTGTPPRPGACATINPAAWTAMASVAGLSPDALSGAQFLVDADGWLRAEERPGETVLRWADPKALLADARAICTTRIAAAPGVHVHH